MTRMPADRRVRRRQLTRTLLLIVATGLEEVLDAHDEERETLPGRSFWWLRSRRLLHRMTVRG